MYPLLLSALHLLLLSNRSVHWCRIINTYQSEWIELLEKVQNCSMYCSAVCIVQESERGISEVFGWGKKGQ